MSSCLILLVHGSKDSRWREPFERLAADLAATPGAGRTALAYMELAAPTLMDVASGLAADGIRDVVILPVFLAAGAHVTTDIPEQAAAVRARHGGLRVTILPPLGEHPRFQALLRELIGGIARDTAAEHEPT